MLKVLETKSERVELELRSDPSRSDREIGRICGVDHKTVAARRAKIPQSGEMGNLNSAVGSLFDPENSPPDSPNDPAPKRRAPISAANADDPNPHVLAGQQEIEIYLNEDGGLVLKQANWPDEDSFIIVAAPYKGIFLDKVCDVLGVM